jgi:hypothetical protein
VSLPAVLVSVCGLLSLAGLAALLLLRPREARGGLLPAALALALLTPSCAVGIASHSLVRVFEQVAQSGTGGKQVIGPPLRQADAWLLAGVVAMLLALGIAFLVLGFSLVAGGRAAGGSLAPASGRRLAFLAALALFAALLAAALVDHTRQNLELVRLVTFADRGTPEAARAQERYPVIGFGIASVSKRLARGFTLGNLGAAYVALVLIGIALAGGLVGGGVAAPRSFTALGLLLLLALLGLGCFWVFRLALELRALS